MDAFPLVSVVLTVFDRKELLLEALNSVLDQTFHSFEIIVADDANDAEIEKICRSLNQPFVRYYPNKSPVGVGLSLRSAIAEARGKYIAILNDDDKWELDFLDRLVGPLEESAQRVLSFADHWIINGDGKIDFAATDANTVKYLRHLLKEGELSDWQKSAVLDHTIPLAMAAVFRKNAVDWTLLVKDVEGAYDYWIACLLASTGRPAYYVSKRLSQYRIHAAMETGRQAPDKNENMVFILAKLRELQLFPELEASLCRKYQDALFACGKDYLRFGDALRARERFRKCASISATPKALAAWLLTYLPPAISRAALRRRSGARAAI
jgi:glycosyltransferase involved in cell wall biosynthesis